MEHKMQLTSDEAIRVLHKKLTQAEKRLQELDRLFIRLYEDNVNSKISDERFAMMIETYEDEQKQLRIEAQNLAQHRSTGTTERKS